MTVQTRNAHKARFGVFEVDFKTGELRRAGLRIRLQAQPFRVLALLLEQAGEVVTREELQQSVWGETTVDFEHSLGTAVNKVRYALGDSAESPRFVETLARRGYRFIAPVAFEYDEAESAATASEPLSAAHAAQPLAGPPAASARPPSLRWPAFAVLALALAAAAGYWFDNGDASGVATPLHVSRLTFSGRVSPGDPFLENLPATATDGARIYFSQMEQGRTVLAEALIANGNTSPLTLPDEIVAPLLGDISPDGSKLIVRNHVAADIEQRLWIVPTLGGAARQIPGVLAHDATWMPDGRHILFAAGDALWQADEDGGSSRLFARLPGRPFWLRWSPNGDRLRVTLLNQANHTTALWQLGADGRNARPLLPGWSAPSAECCGSWTADGRDYVFESGHGGESDIWMLSGHARSPVQLTSGPLEYQAPITSRSGRRIFFVGADTRSELLEFSTGSHSLTPFGDTLSAANRVEFSRDGHWIAWVSREESALWRSRADGAERIQLTARPTEVFMMNWSPDAKQLVFMGREPGRQWQIEAINADGSNLHPLFPENRNQADPDWSPDGRQIVFGRIPALMGEPAAKKALYLLDLASSHVTMLPGSQGLFSPRWSPDGRFIAALSLDMNRIMLFDTATRQWRVLAHTSAADPMWSHDSRWLFFHDYVQRDQSIYRVGVPGGAVERVAAPDDLHYADAVDYQFAGLTPNDTPLVRASLSTANIYAAQLPR